MSAENLTVPETIRCIFCNQAMSYQAMGVEIGVVESTISRWNSGNSDPTGPISAACAACMTVKSASTRCFKYICDHPDLTAGRLVREEIALEQLVDVRELRARPDANKTGTSILKTITIIESDRLPEGSASKSFVLECSSRAPCT